MKHITETERLIIREFDVSDAKKMWELNKDEDVIRFTGDPPFDSIASAQDFLRNYSDYRSNGFGRWAVIEKSTGEFIGWCGLKLNELEVVDLGYRFFKKDWGKGYATESSRGCLAYGFGELGIEEIIGRAATENVPSWKVLEKLGMHFWKEDDCKGIHHARYYRLTRQEFEKQSL